MSLKVSDYLMVAKMIGLEMITSDGVPTENGVPKGCLCIDKTNGGLYQNTGTSTTSTWTDIGSGVGASVSSAEITDGEIVNADINASAAIALSKIDFTVGSDAPGDTFYKTSASALARLGKGTANQMYHMNAGATAPEWVSPLAGLVETTTATATADGLTTGMINALTGLKKFVTVTSANATDAITLPGINVGTIGQEIFLTVGANGFELLTPASSNNTINQVDSDGTNQLDVGANTTVRCTQISATAWLAETIGATTITITAPDND